MWFFFFSIAQKLKRLVLNSKVEKGFFLLKQYPWAMATIISCFTEHMIYSRPLITISLLSVSSLNRSF